MNSIVAPNNAWRDSLMEDLAKREIETRPFFYPVHEFPMYRGCRSDNNCPVAHDLCYRGLSLPTSSYLKKPDIDIISREVRELVLHYPSPYLRAA